MGLLNRLTPAPQRPLWGLGLASLLASTMHGCILPSPSFDEYPPTSGTEPSSTASAGSSTTFEMPTSASSTTPEPTTTAVTTSGETSTSTGSTSTGSTSDDNGVDFPVTSCTALQEFLEAKRLPLTSGVYELQNPQGLDPVEVYCDLEIAGGGWLLAGRSTEAGAAGNFGWRSQTGAADDDELPYSLGFDVHPFPFTELLIGTYDQGKDWGEQVYLLTVPENFVSANAALGQEPTYTEAIKGSCQPADGPTMFNYVGYTDKSVTFWFRDKNASNADFGLNHDRFSTFFFDNCPNGGLLDQKQGMIMVR